MDMAVAAGAVSDQFSWEIPIPTLDDLLPMATDEPAGQDGEAGF